LAFAGDLTNKSQKQKISGIISDIHQNVGDNNYVMVITPDILLAIYHTYKNQEYLFSFLKLEIEKAILISRMISKALSNNFRDAEVKIRIKYKNDSPDEERFRVEINTELNPDEYDKFDKLEHLHDIDGNVQFKNIKDFKVYEKDKLVFSSQDDSQIDIKPEQLEFFLTIQTISDDDSVIESQTQIPFITKNIDGIIKSVINDDNSPLRVEFLYDTKTKNVKFNLRVDNFRGDVIRLMRAFSFWNSLTSAKHLKIVELPSNKIELVTIPKNSFRLVNNALFELVKSLAYIQLKTGYVLRLPNDFSTITRDEIIKINVISHAVEHGKIQKGRGSATFKLSRVHALEILDKNVKSKELSNLEYAIGLVKEKILGVDITLGYGKFRSATVTPVKNAKEVYEKYVKMSDEIVDLQLEFLESEILLEWFSNKDGKTVKNSS
jgi:hypothetical protein